MSMGVILPCPGAAVIGSELWDDADLLIIIIQPPPVLFVPFTTLLRMVPPLSGAKNVVEVCPADDGPAGVRPAGNGIRYR